MAHIDYYFATISPYTYLSGVEMEKVAAKHGATITYKPLDIGGLFGQTGGTPPKDRHPNRQKYRLQDMIRSAKKVGLAINPQPAFFPTNSAPSAYAIIAAQNAGGGDLAKLVHSITTAVWANEQNIAEDDVIKACLEGAGFDPALAEKGMQESADTFARNLEEGIAAGVFGTPFYVVDSGETFWGRDRIEDLDLHLAGKL